MLGSNSVVVVVDGLGSPTTDCQCDSEKQNYLHSFSSHYCKPPHLAM